MSWGRPSIMAASLVTVLSMSGAAHADEKQICVAASEKAQQLRGAGKLVEAREQLSVCGRPECPRLIQQDCTQWMSEVLGSLPSVVPGAKDRKGRDIVDVRLTVDGKVTTELFDGKPIVLDPGVHAFHFETKGAPAVDEQVVVKPGEKNRLVTVTFVTPEEPASGAVKQSGNTGSSPDQSSPPIAADVIGGRGVVALGVALVVDLGANSDARDLRNTCAPKCTVSDVDDVQKKYTIAGVTAVVGGALLITGIVLFVIHGNGKSSTKTGANAPLLSLEPTRSGSAALFRF